MDISRRRMLVRMRQLQDGSREALPASSVPVDLVKVFAEVNRI
ncbi:hypothetical protein SynA1524_01945 [Synechococcus sp. A15-24]|nr:hypothetical protein SynA1524_01945 [Synechococcus sp. A15-24]